MFGGGDSSHDEVSGAIFAALFVFVYGGAVLEWLYKVLCAPVRMRLSPRIRGAGFRVLVTVETPLGKGMFTKYRWVITTESREQSRRVRVLLRDVLQRAESLDDLVVRRALSVEGAVVTTAGSGR
jgi:hypothetical protein